MWCLGHGTEGCISTAEKVHCGSHYSLHGRLKECDKGWMVEGCVYNIVKQAWDKDEEAWAKGNRVHQRFQKRCSSGFIALFKSVQGVQTLQTN